MNRTLFVAALSAAFFFVSCQEKLPGYVPGSSHGKDTTTVVVPPTVKDPDYSHLTADNHPRIMMTKEDEAVIKAKVDAGTDENLSKMHNMIISFADTYLTAKELTHTLEGRRLLSTCTDAAGRFLCLSYAYRMTADTKYLDRAIQDLTSVCNFTDWNAPQHFLDPSEMCYGVGIAYDWLYIDLPDDLKAKMVTCIDNYAFYCAFNKKWNLNFYTSTSNWNQVCNGGLVVAALAIYEACKTDSKKIIEAAVDSNKSKVETMYNPDGNYPEGYGYWSYGSNYECIMLSAMQTCLGTDFGINNIAGWRKTGQWIMFMEGMNRRCFNYCDCDTSSDPMPALWYMAYTFNDQSLLYVELMKLKDGRYSSGGIQRYLPLAAAYASKFDLGEVKAPSTHFWKGDGINPVALAHGDWTFTASDYTMGLKGGVCNNSHGHMDVGSFMFDADGVNWSCDLGLQSYSSIEGIIAQKGGNFSDYTQNSLRWDLFRYNNFNHSTLTINDSKHNVSGKGVFTEIVDTDASRGATLDLSTVLAGQCKSAFRTVTVDNGTDLVVKDVITANTSASSKVRWTMVTRAVPTVYSDYILLQSNGKARYLKVNSSSSRITYKTWSTVGESYDAANNGYYECGFEAIVTSGKTTTFTTTLSLKN